MAGYNFSMKITDQQIIDAIRTTTSMGAACASTGLTFNAFKPRAMALGLYKTSYVGAGVKIPLEEILEGKHPHFQTYKLRHHLIKAGIKENKCENEGCDVGPLYNGKPIQCQLEHKDGNKYNHRLENLEMLCPNCHSQTETFSKKLRVSSSIGDCSGL